MAIISYLGAHWALFFIVVLSVVALGAAGWFFKNIKFIIAAVVLVIAGLAYQSSNMDGYKRRVSEEAQAQVKLLEAHLAAVSSAAAIDSKRALEDAKRIHELENLARETPKNDAPGFSRDATRRVRAIH